MKKIDSNFNKNMKIHVVFIPAVVVAFKFQCPLITSGVNLLCVWWTFVFLSSDRPVLYLANFSIDRLVFLLSTCNGVLDINKWCFPREADVLFLMLFRSQVTPSVRRRNSDMDG